MPGRGNSHINKPGCTDADEVDKVEGNEADNEADNEAHDEVEDQMEDDEARSEDKERVGNKMDIEI